MDARLIIDSPASGSWNMAVDETLFRAAAAGQPPAIRLYRWSRPTLSLGYFQPAADCALHPPSQSLPRVRRASGGGAIIHDMEWTYSLTMRLARDRAAIAHELLVAVHRSLVEFFQRQGVPLQPAVRLMQRRPAPFLCFQRRAAEDLVLGEQKVVGSAQRRQRSALLQHGSILLRRSSAAPELPGIEDLHAAPGATDRLAQDWPDELANSLGWSLARSSLTEAELLLAERIEQERYASSRWNDKR
jgi:lipoate-protein ligase A